MKILIAGGTGTIGRAVAGHLKDRHELILAGAKRGDIQFDLTDPASITNLFKTVGKIDALVATTGEASMKPLDQLTGDDFSLGIRSKLLGQINLTLIGQQYLNPGGSITLTSGVLADDPIDKGAILSTINGAVQGFVIGAAGELIRRGIRINVVSPGVVQDSYEVLKPFFPGFPAIPMDRVADAYVKSIEGVQTGMIIRVF